MEWMDKYRRVAGLWWVAAGLCFQLVWWSVHRVVPGTVTLVLCGAVVLLAVLVLVRSRQGMWLGGWLVAVLLGLDFGGAVADRFGAFGGSGTAGVSWGSWVAFVDYTSVLLPGVDRVAVTAAAAAATGVEVGLCVLLITGWQRRWVAKAAAGLLLVYLLTMLASLGGDAVALYGVSLLIGGALLVSSCPVARSPAPHATKVGMASAERRRATGPTPEAGV